MSYFLNILKNIDRWMLLIIVLFAALSLTMIASISHTDDTIFTKNFIIQAVAYALGFIAMFGVMYLDYNAFEKFEKIVYIGAILFQCLVYTPIGVVSYSARAWINIGFTTMQPSELVKIAFVLLFATYLNRHTKDLVSFIGFCKAFLYSLPLIGVVALEDLGAAIVMSFMFVGMVFYAGLDSRLFLRLAATFCISLPIIYRLLQGHQKRRIDAWLHQDSTTIAEAYQVTQSKIAIGSGGFWGKGLFNGTQKELNWVPVKESDFIYSVIVEELGFVGGAAVLAIYTFFLVRIWNIVVNAKELFGSLITVGFMCMFGFQAFENIAMTMGMMPVTGITLPFISSGGTSILANMMALGIILSVGIRNKSINF